MAHWIGVQSQSNLVKNSKTPPLCDLPQQNPKPKSKKCFLIETRRFRIRRGFEQLSSYSGWRVMAKKVPAT